MALAAYKHDASWLHSYMMFASTVGFSTELRFLRQRPSYMHCCRTLTLALAKLSCICWARAGPASPWLQTLFLLLLLLLLGLLLLSDFQSTKTFILQLIIVKLRI